MRLHEYETSRIARFYDVTASGGQVIFGARLVRALEERYGFVETPKTVAQYDFQAGVLFLHGLFGGETVIDRVQIYNNGITVDAKADTDVCDAFLADLVEWAHKEGGMNLSPTPQLVPPYSSQVVVEASMSLASTFAALNEHAAYIQKTLSSYGVETPPGEVAGFAIMSDLADARWQYRLERRINTEASQNLYFSSAPLKTRDHLSLLAQLEKSLSK